MTDFNINELVIHGQGEQNPQASLVFDAMFPPTVEESALTAMGYNALGVRLVDTQRPADVGLLMLDLDPWQTALCKLLG